MNKFFGKASQKLAIALFVVCAGAALVFKTGAVQNFILNDLALMLIKRPLNYPDVWKHRLDILTHVLLIASFGFGFLYCGATVSRLRYFRDAGRELKDFFHEKCVFNRRNGRILLAIFAIAFLGYFALIRSGVGYLDDLDRSMAGFFGWMFSFGRVVTEALNLAIHGVHLLHDRSPLGQLIAMGFLSVASLVMALVFRGLLLQRGGGKP